jgi:hypothetical protein
MRGGYLESMGNKINIYSVWWQNMKEAFGRSGS